MVRSGGKTPPQYRQAPAPRIAEVVTSDSDKLVVLEVVECLVGVRVHPSIVDVLDVIDAALEDSPIVPMRVVIPDCVASTHAQDEEEEIAHEER